MASAAGDGAKYAEAFSLEHGKVSVDIVLGRIRRGEALEKDISEYFRERVRIEREYAKSLLLLSKKPMTNKDGVGTFSELVDLLVSSTEHIGNSHNTLAQQIADQVEGPLRLRAEEAKAFEQLIAKPVKAFDERAAKFQKSTSDKSRKPDASSLAKYEQALGVWKVEAKSFFDRAQQNDENRLKRCKDLFTRFATFQAQAQRADPSSVRMVAAAAEMQVAGEMREFCRRRGNAGVKAAGSTHSLKIDDQAFSALEAASTALPPSFPTPRTAPNPAAAVGSVLVAVDPPSISPLRTTAPGLPGVQDLMDESLEKINIEAELPIAGLSGAPTPTPANGVNGSLALASPPRPPAGSVLSPAGAVPALSPATPAASWTPPASSVVPPSAGSVGKSVETLSASVERPPESPPAAGRGDLGSFGNSLAQRSPGRDKGDDRSSLASADKKMFKFPKFFKGVKAFQSGKELGKSTKSVGQGSAHHASSVDSAPPPPLAPSQPPTLDALSGPAPEFDADGFRLRPETFTNDPFAQAKADVDAFADDSDDEDGSKKRAARAKFKVEIRDTVVARDGDKVLEDMAKKLGSRQESQVDGVVAATPASARRREPRRPAHSRANTDTNLSTGSFSIAATGDPRIDSERSSPDADAGRHLPELREEGEDDSRLVAAVAVMSGSMGESSPGSSLSSRPPLPPAVAPHTAMRQGSVKSMDVGIGGPIRVNLRVHVTETINALYVAGEVSRILVSGEISVGVVGVDGGMARLASLAARRPHTSAFRVRVANPEYLDRMVANDDFLEAAAAAEGPVSEWRCDAAGLAEVTLDDGPDAAPAQMVPLVKYQVRVEDDAKHEFAPLVVRPLWKCGTDHSDLLVGYQYSPRSRLATLAGNAGLENIEFMVQVGGHRAITNARMKPPGIWSAERRGLLWKVADTEGANDSDEHGLHKHLARFETPIGEGEEVTQSGCAPGPVTVRFTCPSALVSGIDVNVGEVDTDAESDGPALAVYVVEMKKTTVAGKYGAS